METKQELDNAIKTNNIILFNKIIEEQSDDDKYLPLETACFYNRLEMVKTLIEKGAYIHDGFNSLAYAAEHGNIELMKFLYEHSQNIFDEYNGASIAEAINAAIISGSIKAVEFILSLYDHNIITKGFDPIDDEAIELSIKAKNIEMLKFLIQNGANLNKNNGNAFKLANRMKRQRLPCRKLKAILSYLKNIKNDLVLYRAIFANNTGKIEILLGDEQRQFCKETKAWLKFGKNSTPGFANAQSIYKLGILKNKLEKKINKSQPKKGS